MANGVGVNGNLIPPKKGEVRNPKGKPKGTKHLSTWIQEMLNDEEFETFLQHPTKGYVEFKGAPLKAIIQVAIQKAAGGDDKAREWLAKHGYGLRVDLTSGGESLGQIVERLNQGSDYGRLAEQAGRQVVEAEPPIQDQE